MLNKKSLYKGTKEVFFTQKEKTLYTKVIDQKNIEKIRN